MTVNEVTYAVGFKDVSHFGKCFRQTYGINAKDFKKSVSKKNNEA
jgi:transcriptional regulator GlxA family with amidase domain